ncbi:MAG: peptidoglycan-binding protein [Candidatus Paceibacterota bacterium]
MKKLIGIAALTALISIPTFASAATAAELQAQAQALLLQVAALQAQFGTQQSVTLPATVTSNANCPLIGRVLKRGSNGDDVTRLQRFLALDASIYPEGQVTGYYGALTEAAVQRWQTRYNIVSSGSADTTGYGVTGPRTAAAISLQCSTSANVGAYNGPVGGFIQVSPVIGSTPLKVNVQATVNTTNSCTGAAYTLDWGDGSVQQVLTVPAGVCTTMNQSYAHTYIYGGTYIVKLASGTHQTTATVVASGPVAPSPVQVITQTAVLSATPLSGPAPLSVNFRVANPNAGGSYRLDFGDRNFGPVYPAPVCVSCNPVSTGSHTYATTGTYAAKLLFQPPYICSAGAICSQAMPAEQIASTVSITVQANTVAFTYGPLAVTPNVSGNPLSASVSFDLPTSCTGYDLSWGDGSANVTQADSTSCAQSRSIKTFSHQYAGSGSYTVSLRRGPTLAQQDSLSLVISN